MIMLSMVHSLIECWSSFILHEIRSIDPRDFATMHGCSCLILLIMVVCLQIWIGFCLGMIIDCSLMIALLVVLSEREHYYCYYHWSLNPEEIGVWLLFIALFLLMTCFSMQTVGFLAIRGSWAQRHLKSAQDSLKISYAHKCMHHIF